MNVLADVQEREKRRRKVLVEQMEALRQEEVWMKGKIAGTTFVLDFELVVAGSVVNLVF